MARQTNGLIFLAAPGLLLLLGAAGPVTVPMQQPILQGPVGTDIIPGLPYGQFPPGMEPRIPILPPNAPAAPPSLAPPPVVTGPPSLISPPDTLSGCQAYSQAYQRADCESSFNRVRPPPVRAIQENPPLPPNFPSSAAVPAVVPIAPTTPLETHLAPGTITDPRTGRVIPPDRPLP